MGVLHRHDTCNRQVIQTNPPCMYEPCMYACAFMEPSARKAKRFNVSKGKARVSFLSVPSSDSSPPRHPMRANSKLLLRPIAIGSSVVDGRFFRELEEGFQHRFPRVFGKVDYVCGSHADGGDWGEYWGC